MKNLTQIEFSIRVPKLGEIVIFFPNTDDTTARSNNADVCVAIITRSWSSVCANLKIVPDHGPMQDRGSVTHFSANPAGYHFMFQDEYEAYLENGKKNYLAIKKQLIEAAEIKIAEAKRFLEQAKYSREEAREIIDKTKDLKPFIGDVFPPDKKEKDAAKAKYLQEMEKHTEKPKLD